MIVKILWVLMVLLFPASFALLWSILRIRKSPTPSRMAFFWAMMLLVTVLVFAFFVVTYFME